MATTFQPAHGVEFADDLRDGGTEVPLARSLVGAVGELQRQNKLLQSDCAALDEAARASRLGTWQSEKKLRDAEGALTVLARQELEIKELRQDADLYAARRLKVARQAFFHLRDALATSDRRLGEATARARDLNSDNENLAASCARLERETTDFSGREKELAAVVEKVHRNLDAERKRMDERVRAVAAERDALLRQAVGREQERHVAAVSTDELVWFQQTQSENRTLLQANESLARELSRLGGDPGTLLIKGSSAASAAAASAAGALVGSPSSGSADATRHAADVARLEQENASLRKKIRQSESWTDHLNGKIQELEDALLNAVRADARVSRGVPTPFAEQGHRESENRPGLHERENGRRQRQSGGRGEDRDDLGERNYSTPPSSNRGRGTRSPSSSNLSSHTSPRDLR